MEAKLLLWVGGALHLLMVGANFFIPGKLRFKEGLAGAPPIIRQVFTVHHFYIVGILAFFAALCFRFPDELAGASPLGRFVCGFIALFWLCRVPVQLLYYDRELRRTNRASDVFFASTFAALAAIFAAVSVMGGGPWN